jgi:2-oxoglutarate ferredoxin oxidoreductase subunit alpha
MTEGLSFSGIAELPLVLLVSQRTGPSTGLPTYTAQTDLHFVINAGQGEFPRLIVAPGDAQEALYWSAVAVNMAWKFQIPAFILSDKTLSEGTYSVDTGNLPEIPQADTSIWDKKSRYLRYAFTGSGISPLAFPGEKDAVVKANSYAHDEGGITTEESDLVAKMAEKRKAKTEALISDMEKYSGVVVSGAANAPGALLCWGSTNGACTEVADQLGLRVVRPVVLSPFPVNQMKDALKGVRRVVAVEENATAQLAKLAGTYGIIVDDQILRYDGRPFTPDELAARVREVI